MPSTTQLSTRVRGGKFVITTASASLRPIGRGPSVWLIQRSAIVGVEVQEGFFSDVLILHTRDGGQHRVDQVPRRSARQAARLLNTSITASSAASTRATSPVPGSPATAPFPSSSRPLRQAPPTTPNPAPPSPVPLAALPMPSSRGVWPDFHSLLTLSGLLRWGSMSRTQRGWLIVAYILLWFLLIPLHLFVWLAQAFLNAIGRGAIRGMPPSDRHALTGTGPAAATTPLGRPVPLSNRSRNVALGLGSVGVLVTCVLCSGLAAAASNAGAGATDTGHLAQGSVTSVPTVRLSPTAAPKPTATPTAIPTDTPIPVPPTPALVCGDAGCNPWGYNFEPGNFIYNPPGDFCGYFNCIPSFWNQTNGYVEECSDATFSHSGGVQGSCSHHGGNWRPLYSH